MRFADITGGLLQALTGIDPSKGIVPALLGQDNILGGLAGQTSAQIPGMSPLPVTKFEPEYELYGYPQRPYDDYPQHTWADFGPNYEYKGPLPGGPITKAEMDKMNRDYPIGNNITFGVAQS